MPVQDAGEINLGLVPLAPTYPNDGRYPGPDMWYLVRHKLKNLATAQKEEMEKTAKGFVAHNAADRGVHYEFFLGAVAGQSISEAVEAFQVDHGDKEKWADYWVYINLNWGGDIDSAFDGNKKLKLAVGYEEGIPVASPSDDMAFLMQLSQKLYLKNGRFTEASGIRTRFSRQDISVIKAAVQSTINDAVTEERLQSKYNRDDFLLLQAKATERNWDRDDVMSEFWKSVNNVGLWLTALEQE